MMIFPRQLGTSRAIGIQSVIKRIRMRNPSNLIFQSFGCDQLRRMEHVKTADQALVQCEGTNLEKCVSVGGATGRSVTANMPALGAGDSGFESRRPD